MKNRKGSITDPWGTPLDKINLFEEAYVTFTFPFRQLLKPTYQVFLLSYTPLINSKHIQTFSVSLLKKFQSLDHQ